MEENWVVVRKGADFAGIAERFGISQALARLIRNRDVVGDAAIEKYLRGGAADLYDPALLKDSGLLVSILSEKIGEGAHIRVIGDYDIDGVMATCILLQGIRRCGGCADAVIPDRVRDGYGLNMRLIEGAKADGADVILTCDNGISAIGEIARAKELGMTVLVTDHHEIPFSEEGGERRVIRSEADAIVNPRQPDCPYPFKSLCGAAIAYKVVQLLYEGRGIPRGEADRFLEHVAFATVGDVMDLVDENRILVREGISRIRKTKNVGFRALILQNKLDQERISAYHLGFVLGPCVNASGRLEEARLALSLFMEEDAAAAASIAARLVELNAQRKQMTEQGAARALEIAGTSCAGQKVLVIYLPDVHESVAGIIAGRVREALCHPVFVLTDSGDAVKGSGRSIEAYSMYEELCKCKELFTKFGGHPMAAGLTLPRENVGAFAEKINACCELTESDFIPKIKIDIALPISRATEGLAREIGRMEPFGKGNPKPLFADRDLSVLSADVAGKNRSVLRLRLASAEGPCAPAVYFGDIEAWKGYYSDKFGEREVEAAMAGRENRLRMTVAYEPQLDSWQGAERLQLVIRHYK